MTIRKALLTGCFALAMLTVAVGTFAVSNMRDLGASAERLHADGVVPLATLWRIQQDVQRTRSLVSGGSGADQVGSSVPDLLPSLVDLSGQLSLAGSQMTAGPSRNQIVDAGSTVASIVVASGNVSLRKIGTDLDSVERRVTDAVKAVSSQAEAARGELFAEQVSLEWKTIVAILLALAGAGALTLLLTRQVVPPVRRAARIARSIAEGRLDNEIARDGHGEMAQLMTALSDMQSSIRGRFEQSRLDQSRIAADYDGTIATQSARFEAAVANMSQALCLLDGKGRLVVDNEPFRKVFGQHETGTPIGRILPQEVRAVAFVSKSVDNHEIELADGRTLSVSSRAISTGGHVLTMDDITERCAAYAKSRWLASHDVLTDLPNRASFVERLEKSVSSDATCVLCLDLDGFKNVNDTFGHPAGDALLRQVGERLVAAVRSTDLVARIGGDEFAIVLGNKPRRTDVESLAERIILAVGRPVDLDGQELRVGVSIGIAMVERDSGSTSKSIVRKADLALYDAKSAGRNAYRFYEEAMGQRVDRRRGLEDDLRLALGRGELELFYQPFLDAVRDDVSGFEALIRWHHPTLGMVSPAEFIPIAEESGLIDEIGAWSLEQACMKSLSWPSDVSVSVNVSPYQFRNPNLVRSVAGILAKTGLSPARLQIEVTESLFLSGTERNVATMNALRDLGVRLSMDDFGTGYSSLAYLTRFTFDKVKIDQTFVRNIHLQQNLAIIQAVISLGSSLGIAVIAEGVETAEQRRILLSKGCVEMQGYLFGRPMPVADADAFLASVRHPVAIAA